MSSIETNPIWETLINQDRALKISTTGVEILGLRFSMKNKLLAEAYLVISIPGPGSADFNIINLIIIYFSESKGQAIERRIKGDNSQMRNVAISMWKENDQPPKKMALSKRHMKKARV